MKNTEQNINNTEDSFSERQDEARNEPSECSCPQSSGSDGYLRWVKQLREETNPRVVAYLIYIGWTVLKTINHHKKYPTFIMGFGKGLALSRKDELVIQGMYFQEYN